MPAYCSKKSFDSFLVFNDALKLQEEKVKLSSGRRSNMYINIREIMDDVVTFDKLKWFVEGFMLDNHIGPDYFIGVPEGMTKLGLIMTYSKHQHELRFSYESYLSEGYSKRYHIPIARKKAKKHGSGYGSRFLGGVEGKAVVLEDVLTTGDSAIRLVEDLKRSGADVLAVVGIVDRLELRKDGLSVKEKFAKMQVEYHSITDITTLLPLACEKLKPEGSLTDKIVEYYRKYGIKGLKINI